MRGIARFIPLGEPEGLHPHYQLTSLGAPSAAGFGAAYSTGQRVCWASPVPKNNESLMRWPLPRRVTAIGSRSSVDALNP